MHRIRDQTHTLLRVVTFHRFHQADVTFLNEVSVR